MSFPRRTDYRRARPNCRPVFIGCLLAALPALQTPSVSQAVELAIHPLCGSGAVLQQGRVIPIFGTADDGQTVTVRFQDQQRVTTAENGRWQVDMGPFRAGGPFTMQVATTRTVSASDVLVGEVWICAGDGNMQWQVLNSTGSVEAMTARENPQVRFFTVRREAAADPISWNAAFWTPAGAGSVGVFSAVGYHFGRELQRKLQVPIGLIACNHHHATAASFISRNTLAADPELKSILDDEPPNPAVASTPTVLYNGMAHGMLKYAGRGVVWYAGQNELDHAYRHRRVLAALIADWRTAAGNETMPFLIVQAAPFGGLPERGTGVSRLAELRDSQMWVWRNTHHTAMIVATDFGSRYELHPREKPPVGARLALAARAVAYGEALEYSGPVYRAQSIDGSRVRLELDHVGTGLETPTAELRGFTVAGADRVFKPAKATIEGNAVVVQSDAVPAPKAVRFGWADYPDLNFRNREGLPASPFRTDDFPVSTTPVDVAQ